MYELYRRDGYSKNKIATAQDLEELAEIVAAKTGSRITSDELLADGGDPDAE